MLHGLLRMTLRIFYRLNFKQLLARIVSVENKASIANCAEIIHAFKVSTDLKGRLKQLAFEIRQVCKGLEVESSLRVPEQRAFACETRGRWRTPSASQDRQTTPLERNNNFNKDISNASKRARYVNKPPTRLIKSSFQHIKCNLCCSKDARFDI